MMKNGVVRRLSILVLAALMVMTCIPLYEGAAFAAEGEIEDEIVRLSDDEFKAEKAKAEAELDAKMGVSKDTLADDAEADAVADTKASEPVLESPKERPVVSEKALKGLKLNGYDDTGMFIYVDDEPDETGHVGIYSADLSETDYYYTDIRVGDEPDDILYENKKAEMAYYPLSGSDQKQFSKTIDMKAFTVGYHTIFVGISDGSEIRYAVVRKIPTYIYEAPGNSLSNYYTYPKKFSYKYTGSTYYEYSGEYLSMFMDYRKKGSRDWGKYVYRMDYSGTGYVKKGLKPNTTYQVRQMLGKTFEYDGAQYTFTGRQSNCVSPVKAIKTAYMKPKAKSIKISKGRIKVQKWKVLYAYRYRYRVNKRTGYRRLISITPLYHHYRKYYTKFKVTVKFRKKQDIAGLYIGTIHGLYAYKKGNKKSYSQSFTCTGKKKGKKITVKIFNWRSNTYGGYSKKLKKKVRV